MSQQNKKADIISLQCDCNGIVQDKRVVIARHDPAAGEDDSKAEVIIMKYDNLTEAEKATVDAYQDLMNEKLND